MIESILKELRDNVIHDSECTDFDNELIPLINSYLMTLNQNGIGVVGYRVTGEDQTWNEFLEGSKILEATVEYVNLSVRIVFDPPSSATVLAAFQAIQAEYLWRLRHAAEEGV